MLGRLFGCPDRLLGQFPLAFAPVEHQLALSNEIRRDLNTAIRFDILSAATLVCATCSTAVPGNGGFLFSPLRVIHLCPAVHLDRLVTSSSDLVQH